MTVVTNHHIVITDEEQNMIVNALTFFDQAFLGNRELSLLEWLEEWRDVANDTRLSRLDELANKIATSN